MSAAINVDGTVYELPKFTLAVAERNQTVGKTTDLREKAAKMFDFLGDVLGRENVSEIVDGDTYEEADLAAMTNLFVKVNTAYTNAMNEESDNNLQNKIEAAQRMAGTIESIVKSADKVSSVAANNSEMPVVVNVAK